ncbi:unnamed protein product [Hapterophycus canaliculatus]
MVGSSHRRGKCGGSGVRVVRCLASTYDCGKCCVVNRVRDPIFTRLLFVFREDVFRNSLLLCPADVCVFTLIMCRHILPTFNEFFTSTFELAMEERKEGISNSVVCPV